MGVNDVPPLPLSADEVARLLKPLTQREREALALRLGLDRDGCPRTRDEVALAFGITHEDADKILNSAERKLRRGNKGSRMPSQETPVAQSDDEIGENVQARGNFIVELDGHVYSWHLDEFARENDLTEPEISPELQVLFDKIDEDEEWYQRTLHAQKVRRLLEPISNRRKQHLNGEAKKAIENPPLPPEIKDLSIEDVHEQPMTVLDSHREPSTPVSILQKLLSIEKAFSLFQKGALLETEFTIIKAKILSE